MAFSLLGKKAPYFEVIDVSGNELKLKEGKPYILGFMRYMGCIYCQLDIANLLRAKNKLSNTRVILFTESSDEVVREYMSGFTDFPFHIVSDPEKKIYSLYGVDSGSFLDLFMPSAIRRNIEFLFRIGDYKFLRGGLKGTKYLRPAVFGVNERGEVVFEHRTKNIAEPLDIGGLFSALGI